MAPLDSHFFHIHPPPKSHQPPSPYLINNERSLNWLIEKTCIILFTELKSIPSLNKKANRGYHKTSSEDDKAPRGMGNFHIKRKGCSYVLVVKKVVLVFLMLFSRTKSTAGTFASELTMWNEVVYYVRIDISEGRKKNSSKVHKTASGYLLEIVFTLSDEAPLPPPPTPRPCYMGVPRWAQISSVFHLKHRKVKNIYTVCLLLSLSLYVKIIYFQITSTSVGLQ